MICLHSMTDQTNCCVDDGMESVQELCRKADQQRVTVIKLRQHKTGDKRHNSKTRQRPLNAPQLKRNAETACGSSGDVCRHGRISVQVNAEVTEELTGVTLSAPTRSGTAGTWYMRRLVTHHITSVSSTQIVDTGRWNSNMHNVLSFSKYNDLLIENLRVPLFYLQSRL